MGTFSGVLSHVSEAAEQVFDYIMNTQPAYKKLGEAVREMEQDARVNANTTAKKLLTAHVGDQDWSARDKDSFAWKKLVFDAVRLARTDYRKHFRSEQPDFRQNKMMEDVNVFDIMKLALQHRDRFNGGTGLGALKEKVKISWLQDYMTEVIKHAKTPVDHHNELPYGHMVAGTMTPAAAAKSYLKQTRYGYRAKARK